MKGTLKRETAAYRYKDSLCNVSPFLHVSRGSKNRLKEGLNTDGWLNASRFFLATHHTHKPTTKGKAQRNGDGLRNINKGCAGLPPNAR